MDEQLKERIEMLTTCGFVEDSGRNDLYKIADILENKYQIPVDDDTAGVLITHIAAALKRAREGEKVEPLEADILAQVSEIQEYETALSIRKTILEEMANELSPDEQDFLLVHIGTILQSTEG